MDLIYRDDGWLTETCVQYGGKHIQPVPDNESLQVVLGCKFKGVFYVRLESTDGKIIQEKLAFGYADAKRILASLIGKKPVRKLNEQTGKMVIA